MVKTFILIVATLLFWNGYGQSTFLEGTWQGILERDGMTLKSPTAVWIKFKIDPETNIISGEARNEIPFTDYYALKTIKGKSIERNEINFEDLMLGNQKNSGNKFWCLLKGELTYNDSTGYLEGRYSSSDCRSNIGKITLYRSKYEMSVSDTVSKYHSWVTNFQSELKRGWNAYYVRDKEMRDFEMKPVYFDHDKDIVKTESQLYLKQMVRIVSSHSDLRIKIIGHTDSNGEDVYNISLSKRRANNVKNILMQFGLSSDRIVIEYRGEKDPAVSNVTVKGKQLNRRVDFEFV